MEVSSPIVPSKATRASEKVEEHCRVGKGAHPWRLQLESGPETNVISQKPGDHYFEQLGDGSSIILICQNSPLEFQSLPDPTLPVTNQ